MAYPLPDKPSIAVLPFDNMSGDPEQEYFSDGLTEEIITALSKTDQLFVIARNSTFTYKGKPVKVQQVAEDLGIRYVLEGSVRKDAERVRITAQLVDALEGIHLWAERYDRDLQDIFAIQDDITKQITAALHVKLTIGGDAVQIAGGTDSLEAFLKYLKSREYHMRMTKEDNVISRRLAEEAISIDPDYGVAYALLGATHMLDAWLQATDSPKRSIGKAIELEQKAIALGANAHDLVGFLYLTIRQHDKAIAECRKAVNLNPSSSTARTFYGLALGSSGRFEEAVLELEQGVRLDPFSSSFSLRSLGNAYSFLGRHEEAISVSKKAVQRAPNDLISHLILTRAYSMAGRMEEARAGAAEILRINPKFSLESYSKTLNFKNQADDDRAIEALRKAGLPETPPLPLPDKPSIAVLPFVNMSDDKSQEYFSDGITEEIITALSKTPNLFVIARTSSFKYKGKEVDVKQVSRELGVKYVLEGSVRRSGDQLRITAQLIDAATGNHLWAERYDRKMKDVFTIQDEVTMKILTSLQVSLTEGESARFLAAGTTNLEAYLKTLEARELSYRLNKDDTALSIKMCEEAIALDPQFSGAYAVLSGGYSLKFAFGINPLESLSKAYEYARKSVSLDPAQLAAYKALEFVCGWRKQHDEAVRAGEQAVKVAPGSADAYLALGRALNFSCRDEEAIGYLEKGIRMNPYPPSHYYMHLGWAQFNSRQYEQAVSSLRKAVSMSPRNQPARLGLIATYIEVNKVAEAKSEAQELLKIDPKYTSKGYQQRAPWKDPEVMRRWVEALRKAGLERELTAK
ncbi:MAG: tetratricopeptide repeat protein [Desulfatiglandaceae bacterium]